MGFGQPLLLLLLAVLLPLFAAWLWLARWRRAAARRLVGGAPQRVSRRRRLAKLSLLAAGLALVAVAAALPRRGERRILLPREGSDVIIGLDVSASMLATDVQPNRLDRAKGILTGLLDRLPGDRIGLVVFAGNAGLRFPLTTDVAVARELIGSTTIKDGGLAPGTGIGDAIRLAVSTFPPDTQTRSRVLVLVTDGEDLAGGPLDAAQQARAQNIVVHTVGVGTDAGGTIVLPTAGRGTRSTPAASEPATSRRDAGLLRQIAEVGRGRYFDAANDDVAAGLANEIGRLERTAFESQEGTLPIERFQPFVAAALVLLVLELLLTESPGRRRGRKRPATAHGRRRAPPAASAASPTERPVVAVERAHP